jgi:hypothetical protein
VVSTFLTAISAQLILLVTGLALFQIVSPMKKISLWPHLPYAWAAGVLYLFVMGGILVRIPIFEGTWHLPIVLLSGVLIGFAFIRRHKAPGKKTDASFKMSWVGSLFLGLLAFKIAAVFYVLMVNPVIDSDAANPFRWMGLAKLMGLGGSLSDHIAELRQITIPRHEIPNFDRFSPPLLAAWTHLFLPRWHDSLVSLPWFFTYLSIIGTAFALIYRTTLNETAASLGTYFFASIPMISIHVVRPGYADVILTYYLIVALSFLLLMVRCGPSKPLILFVIVATVGCMLSKREGVIWSGVLYLTLAGVVANKHYSISWIKILMAHLCLITIGWFLYYFVSDIIVQNFTLDHRYQWLFQKRYNPHALKAFFDSAFCRGSFNLCWWFVMLMSLFLMVRKTTEVSKVVTFSLFLFFLAVLYYTSFTGNIEATLAHTNVGRLLLQISGIFLPIYALFVKEVILENSS